MNKKLKGWILFSVGMLALGIVVLVAITMLSGVSTNTIYNLRFLEPAVEGVEQRQEVLDKEKFLSASSENNFLVEVDCRSSETTTFVVQSSNPEVATIEAQEDNLYRVEYTSEGKTTISVSPAGGGNIYDSFVLTVRNNIPNTFKIPAEEGNEFILGENHLQIYADTKEYAFDFVAMLGEKAENINLDGVSVLDNYNHDVFDKIYIDAANSQLVIKAKQSEYPINENITIQTKYQGENGVVTGNFVVRVNVLGYTLSNIQLIVSETPAFEGVQNVFGNGRIYANERKIDELYFTNEVSTIYARIRIVYTNGDLVDVTSLPQTTFVVSQNQGSSDDYKISKVSLQYGNYWVISIKANMRIQFSVGNLFDELPIVELQFSYIDPDTATDAYNAFVNKLLYRKYVDVVDGKTYYEYIYWDSRYQREDAITSADGRILGFLGGNPDCNLVEDPYHTTGESVGD